MPWNLETISNTTKLFGHQFHISTRVGFCVSLLYSLESCHRRPYIYKLGEKTSPSASANIIKTDFLLLFFFLFPPLRSSCVCSFSRCPRTASYYTIHLYLSNIYENGRENESWFGTVPSCIASPTSSKLLFPLYTQSVLGFYILGIGWQGFRSGHQQEENERVEKGTLMMRTQLVSSFSRRRLLLSFSFGRGKRSRYTNPQTLVMLLLSFLTRLLSPGSRFHSTSTRKKYRKRDGFNGR